MAKEKLFEVTDEKGTPINTMEGNATVKYKYEDEEEFVEVLDEPVEKGVVKAEDGEFPAAAPGKTIEEAKIEVIPSNYDFYKSRSASKMTSDPKKVLDGEDKFKLEGTLPRTKADREAAKNDARVSKLEKLG